MNYYDILGVAHSATRSEIKLAYRRKAARYHPDRHPGDKVCEEKFKEAKAAYEVLYDAKKRAEYDRYGTAKTGPGPASPRQEADIAAVARRMNGIITKFNNYIDKRKMLGALTKRANRDFKAKFPGLSNYFNRLSYNRAERKKAESYLHTVARQGLADISLMMEIQSLTREINRIIAKGSGVNYPAANEYMSKIEKQITNHHGLIDNCLGVISGRTETLNYTLR